MKAHDHTRHPWVRPSEVCQEFRGKIALVGQPNSGKTSLFNRLTGSSQQVGNWPGVTVEKKEGIYTVNSKNYSLNDLPGVYSLSSYTLEERITRDFLLSENPDLILNIVDSTNLERQLFLTVQLLLLRKPMVIILNMMDEAREKALLFDIERLVSLLGVPVCAVSVRNGEGVDHLQKTIEKALEPCADIRPFRLSDDDFTETMEECALIIQQQPELSTRALWYAFKYLEGDPEVEAFLEKECPDKSVLLAASRGLLSKKTKTELPLYVSDWIYGITRGLVLETVRRTPRSQSVRSTVTLILDSLALNRFTGLPVFLAVLLGMFQATFFIGDLFISMMEGPLEQLAAWFSGFSIPWLASLLSNGLVGGVGNVVLLLPYVLIMFLLMSVLEDSGYMARAAFVMDRWMHRLGLHGKSFIPLVMGFGCNVPAIMAARTLESQEERIKTALMIPYMLCSARLPVFVLFTAAFFPRHGGLVMFFLYLLGILIGIGTGLLLKKTFLNTQSEGLIMELPPYRLPHWKNTLLSTWLKVKEYLIKAGTIIFAVSLVLWLLSYLPLGVEYGSGNSILGMIGKALSFLVAPLGFDWRMTVSLITGFAAKEVVLATLGVLYGAGENLQTAVGAVMSAPAALAYMVFVLVYTPCLATVAILKSETNSWKWTIFSIVYSLVLAWVLSFTVYRVGSLFIN